MKKYTYTFILGSILLPVLSFAEPLGGVKSLVIAFGNILNTLIPIMFGLALIYFFWGLAEFILHSGEEDALKSGKQKMLWGIVALFVFVSIFGILKFVGSSLGIEQGGLLDLTGSGNNNSSGNFAPGDNPMDPYNENL